MVIADWKEDHNHRRRHSALGYQAPAQYAINVHPQVKRTGCGLFGGNRPGRSERFMHGQEGLAAGRCAAVDGDVNEYFLDLTHCCAAGQRASRIDRQLLVPTPDMDRRAD